MNRRSSKIQTKIRPNGGESGSSGKMTSAASSGDIATIIKTEKLQEPPECSAIKTEEISINSDLPTEEDDSCLPTSKGNKTKNAFKCYFCNTFMKDKKSLSEHLLSVHHKQDLYTCGECSQQKTNIVMYNLHLQLHDASIRPHKCSVCSFRFTTIGMKKQHEANVHQISNGRTGRSTCPVCDKKIRSELLEQHLESEHPDARQACSTCGEGFYSKNKLKQHTAAHRRADKLLIDSKCYLCEPERLLESKDLLQQHLNEAHAKQSKYKCEECGYSVKEIAKFNTHHSAHDTANKLFECHRCYQRFTRWRALKHHELFVHNFDEDTPQFYCTICKKKFVGPKELTRHMKTHAGKCYICSTVLVDENTLKQHIEMKHHVSSYQCNECNFFTSRSISFNKHLMRHDASMNPFGCRFCKLRFSEERNRAAHEATQHKQSTQTSNAKTKTNMKCYLCSDVKHFQTPNALIIHLRVMHPTKPIYKCTKCSYKTAVKSNFNKHHAKHPRSVPTTSPKADGFSTGKQFSCSTCHKKFTLEHRKISHERRMHNWNSYTNKIQTTPAMKVKCYLCPVQTVMENKIKLEQHLRAVHTPESTYQCRKCGYRTKDSSYFNNHRSRYDPLRRKFKCTFCQRRFLTAGYKRYHENLIHKNNLIKRMKSAPIHQPEQVSTIYGSYFVTIKTERPDAAETSFSALSSRLNSAIFRANNRFKCYLCNTVTQLESRNSLHLHLATAHQDQEGYHCGECNTSLLSKTTFNQHLSRHDAIERPHKCGFCSLRFTSRSLKKRHEIFLHYSENVFKDAKQYSSDEKLKSHEVEMHEVKHETFGGSTCDKTVYLEKRQDNTLALSVGAIKREELQPENHSDVSNAGSTSSSTASRSPTTTVDTDTIGIPQQNSSVAPVQSIPNNIFTISDIRTLYRCHLCTPNKMLDTRESLLQHLKSHPAQDMYQCDKCSFSVSLVTMFNQHLAQHSTT